VCPKPGRLHCRKYTAYAGGWGWVKISFPSHLSQPHTPFMARAEEFRLYFYSGHKGRFGHEFLRFDIDGYGNLRYANQSNYRRDSIIRKNMRLSPALVGEIKRIIDDSEIMRETDQKWPEKDQEGRPDTRDHHGRQERVL
ncbi:Mago nashi protein, partial [Linderina pennispora]